MGSGLWVTKCLIVVKGFLFKSISCFESYRHNQYRPKGSFIMRFYILNRIHGGNGVDKSSTGELVSIRSLRLNRSSSNYLKTQTKNQRLNEVPLASNSFRNFLDARCGLLHRYSFSQWGRQERVQNPAQMWSTYRVSIIWSWRTAADTKCTHIVSRRTLESAVCMNKSLFIYCIIVRPLHPL